eukprot:UN28438
MNKKWETLKNGKTLQVDASVLEHIGLLPSKGENENVVYTTPKKMSKTFKTCSRILEYILPSKLPKILQYFKTYPKEKHNLCNILYSGVLCCTKIITKNQVRQCLSISDANVCFINQTLKRRYGIKSLFDTSGE